MTVAELTALLCRGSFDASAEVLIEVRLRDGRIYHFDVTPDTIESDLDTVALVARRRNLDANRRFG